MHEDVFVVIWNHLCLVNFELSQRGSSSRENVGRSSLSQGNQTAAGVVIENQNPPNTSSAAETSRFFAAFTIFLSLDFPSLLPSSTKKLKHFHDLKFQSLCECYV